MMAWMNAESLQLTLERGETVFWSRSRQELWHKGATSGNTQKITELRYDLRRATRCLRLCTGRPRLPYRRHQLLLPHAEGVLTASAFAFRGGRAFACPPFLVLPQLVRIA